MDGSWGCSRKMLIPRVFMWFISLIRPGMLLDLHWMGEEASRLIYSCIGLWGLLPRLARYFACAILISRRVVPFQFPRIIFPLA